MKFIEETNNILTTTFTETTNIITNEIITTEMIKSEIITNEIMNNKSEIETEKEKIFNNCNKTDILEGNDKEKQIDNVKITLTTVDNQKNNEYKNTTTIDIGQCENILKENHNISKNETLYIVKYDIEEEGMKIPKI